MHGTHTVSLKQPPLNRHGKKRRKRAREGRTATGRERRTAPDYKSLAAAQPHRRGLPEALRLSEKAGTVLGCLNLLQAISDDQYEAGRRYSVVVGAYHAVIETPNATGGGGRGYNCAGTANCKDCECRARMRRYTDAYEAIPSRAAHLAIIKVAIWNEICEPHQVEALKLGLSALARHFGLTSKGKSAQ